MAGLRDRVIATLEEPDDDAYRKVSLSILIEGTSL